MPVEGIDQPRSIGKATDLDWFLKLIVAQVNRNDVEIGLTLSVGGLLISGTAISQRKYFEEVAAAIKTARPGDDERAASARNGIARAIEDFPSKMWDLAERRVAAEQIGDAAGAVGPTEAAQQLEEQISDIFIHLRDVRIHASDGQVVPLSGALWRGSIKAVDGFWIGEPNRTSDLTSEGGLWD